ncbi:hypothetical protein AQF98_06530 [Pedobacter sp. Hv1]|nr:hypothetical protein AQF98_06530 [Pedobacter sp. Hv1]
MRIEIRIDDSIIMMSDATPQYPANKYWMHIYVPNVDDTFKKTLPVDVKLLMNHKQKKTAPPGVERLKILLEICGRWLLKTKSIHNLNHIQ